MRLSLQSQCHKLSYNVRISTWQLLGQWTEPEVVQMFCLLDLPKCHYNLQDISPFIVQHPQNCGADLKSSHKTQFVFACSNYQHNMDKDGLPSSFGIHTSSSLVVSSDIQSLASLRSEERRVGKEC